jgi:hypothetical protein
MRRAVAELTEMTRDPDAEFSGAVKQLLKELAQEQEAEDGASEEVKVRRRRRNFANYSDRLDRAEERSERLSEQIIRRWDRRR